MKNHRPLLLVVLILLVGMASWWHCQQNAPAPALPSIKKTPAKNENAKPAASTLPGKPQTSAQSSPAINQVQALLGRDLTPEEKQQLQDNPEKAQAALAYLNYIQAPNKNSINVYGKVVDQFGQPVPDVNVKGGTLLIGPGVSGGRELDTKTDGNGLFSFVGLEGARFGVLFEKQGYESDSRTYAYWWDHYKPDPANPSVFIIYKLQGAEPMVHTKFGRTIPCDGTPVHYDLLTGKEVTSGGGLVVTFTRNPVQIKRGTPFEWTLTLQVPGGGLVEENDPYPYLAPESGYQETITITTGPNPKTYVDSTTKTYYYKSADGKYGRLFISLQADFQPPPTSFDGSIYLNPSGSRNLEFDPAKQVKP